MQIIIELLLQLALVNARVSRLEDQALPKQFRGTIRSQPLISSSPAILINKANIQSRGAVAQSEERPSRVPVWCNSE